MEAHLQDGLINSDNFKLEGDRYVEGRAIDSCVWSRIIREDSNRMEGYS